jgi:hypothetical protein
MSLSINPNTVRDSSLVLDIDPANELTFRGPVTQNFHSVPTNVIVYNNQSANITTTLTLLNETYRGGPIYRATYTPVNQTGVDQFSNGVNGGVGLFYRGTGAGADFFGGGTANNAAGYSIFFRANKPLHTNPTYNQYSNVPGYLPQYNSAFDDMGDGWFRAYTVWSDTVTRFDGDKYWAINPARIAINETITVDWAAPFKEVRNDTSYVSPYYNGTRGATVTLDGGVIDASGRDNNGTLTGDIRFDTANRGSWSFSGNTANFISIPDNDSLSFLGNSFTLDFWINVNTGQNDFGVLGKRDPWEYSVFADGSGNLIFDSWNLAGNGNYYHTPPVVTNQWVHYCQSANGTTSTLYINGVIHSTMSRGTNTMGNGPSPLNIGLGGRGDGLRPMKGKIGPVKVYNRALTQTEVIQNFNAIRGRYSI